MSVVLLTHNRPEWLNGALRSVLDGHFTDVEVVVSDNGDPTGSRALARSIDDDRVRWVEYDRRSGMVEHHAAALGQARGRYVAVLHDDDRWEPDHLSTLVPPLEERDDAVLAFCDHTVVDELGKIDDALTESVSREFGRADLPVGFHQPFFGLVARQSIPITGAVFRRSALPVSEIVPELSGFLDVWLAYLLAGTGGAAYYSGRRSLHYRRHGTSSTSGREVALYEGAIRYRGRMRSDPRMHDYDDLLRRKLAGDHLSLGAVLLRLEDRPDARRHLWESLRLQFSVKAVGGLTLSRVVPPRLLQKLM